MRKAESRRRSTTCALETLLDPGSLRAYRLLGERSPGTQCSEDPPAKDLTFIVAGYLLKYDLTQNMKVRYFAR